MLLSEGCQTNKQTESFAAQPRKAAFGDGFGLGTRRGDEPAFEVVAWMTCQQFGDPVGV